MLGSCTNLTRVERKANSQKTDARRGYSSIVFLTIAPRGLLPAVTHSLAIVCRGDSTIKLQGCVLRAACCVHSTAAAASPKRSGDKGGCLFLVCLPTYSVTYKTTSLLPSALRYGSYFACLISSPGVPRCLARRKLGYLFYLFIFLFLISDSCTTIQYNTHTHTHDIPPAPASHSLRREVT